MKFEYSAGVIIYTVKNGRRYYLFLKHNGWLDMPKGHIEKGETAEEAALRETKEESGIDAILLPHFRHDVNYWFMRGKQKVKKKVTFFIAKVPNDIKVKVSWEHEGYEWVDLEKHGEKLKFKDQVQLIKKANAYVNKLELLSRINREKLKLHAAQHADSYIDRIERMEKLNEEYARLPKRHRNWRLSGNFVPGHGPLDAKIMIVGQAPGRNEDIQRKPFIGAAGKLLTEMIKKAGLKRDDIYISSIVQFFPPDNRLPTKEEARQGLPFLERQIAIVKPKLIIVLGNFAAENLLGMKEVMKNHGTLIRSKKYGCDVFVTLHPAAVVRMKKHTPVMEADFVKLGKIAKDL